MGTNRTTGNGRGQAPHAGGAAELRGREELDDVEAGVERAHDLAWRSPPREGPGTPSVAAAREHGLAEPRADDEPGTGVDGLVDLVGGDDAAGADEHAGRLGQRVQRLEGRGRPQGDLGAGQARRPYERGGQRAGRAAASR